MRFAFYLVLFLGSFISLRGADNPTPDEQKAIDAIERAGGKANLDPKLTADARVSARFDAITDSTLSSIKKLPQIGSIEALDATKCTEKGYGALKELPHLRRLVLATSNLKLADATAIGQCKELRYLGLVEAGLTDAELVALQKLTLLEHLSLSNNAKITDKGMQTVKCFERLRELYLANTGLTDKGLAELTVLDGLRTLNVANTRVTADAADKFVEEMPNLRSVRR